VLWNRTPRRRRPATLGRRCDRNGSSKRRLGVGPERGGRGPGRAMAQGVSRSAMRSWGLRGLAPRFLKMRRAARLARGLGGVLDSVSWRRSRTMMNDLSPSGPATTPEVVARRGEEPSVVLFLDEVARLLRVSRSTIERRRRDGSFPIPELPLLDRRPRW